MRFVIEGLGLTSKGARAGSLRLLPELVRHTEHEFLLLFPDLPEYSGIRATNVTSRLRPKPANLLARFLYLNHAVPRICKDMAADALLCLGNLGPFWSPVPTVVMIQSLYYVYHEPVAMKRATLRNKAIIRYGRSYLARADSADAFIVQTPIVRDRLSALYNIDPSRVVVIPDTDTLPMSAAGNPSQVRHSPTDPFTFLCLGAYAPHKNQEILLEAVERVPAYSRRQFKCLITVSADLPRARRIIERISRTKSRNALVNIGPVYGPELERAYVEADAIIQPTLMETFGRVYSEAMHFGLPILTSDRDFAHEHCQNAAIYFDPLDPESVAKAMAKVMEDADLRARLVGNGKRLLAKSPTWDEIATQFVEVLERVAKGLKSNGRPSPICDTEEGEPSSAVRFSVSREDAAGCR